MLKKNKQLIAENLECYRNKRRKSLEGRSRKAGRALAKNADPSFPSGQDLKVGAIVRAAALHYVLEKMD